MSIVAPITATGAVIPVVVGVATGERPTPLGAGLLLALAGVGLAARRHGGEELGPRLAAGVGLALLARGRDRLLPRRSRRGERGRRAVGTARPARRLSRVVLAAAASVRPHVRLPPVDLVPMLAIGALDISANALFAVASTRGLVSLVAVLASLYR
jgi:hypothetical protein